MKQLQQAIETFEQDVLHSLQKQIIPWRARWDQPIFRPYDASLLADYEGMEILNLWMKSLEYGYRDPRWMTFKEANERGYHIKKGSKGTQMAHNHLRNQKENEEYSFHDYMKLSEAEQTDVTPMYHTYKIFHASQIQGMDASMEETPILFKKEQTAQFLNHLKNQMDGKFNDSVEHQESLHKRELQNEEERYATDLMLLSQRMLHNTPDALNNSLYEGIKQDTLQALVCDLATTLQMLGMGMHPSSYQCEQQELHLKEWSEMLEENPGVLSEAIFDARKLQRAMQLEGNYIQTYVMDEKIEQVNEQKNIVSDEKKEKYKNFLSDLLLDDEELKFDGDLSHAIYQIDDIIIGGGFYDGVRSNDHYSLLNRNFEDKSNYFTFENESIEISWEEILNFGTLIVPETQSYISNTVNNDLEDLGFSALPLNDNHIIGFVEKAQIEDEQLIEKISEQVLEQENEKSNYINIEHQQLDAFSFVLYKEASLYIEHLGIQVGYSAYMNDAGNVLSSEEFSDLGDEPGAVMKLTEVFVPFETVQELLEFEAKEVHGRYLISPEQMSDEEAKQFNYIFKNLTNSNLHCLSEETTKQVQERMLQEAPMTYEKMIAYRDAYITQESIKAVSLATNGRVSEEDIREWLGFGGLSLQLEKDELSQEERERTFIDMDGVLSLFNNQISSLDVLYEEGYFANLEPQESVVKAVKELIKEKPTQVYILSAALDSPYAVKEKTEWLNQYLPELKQEQMIFTEYGKSKVEFIPGGLTKGDVLLDDYTKNLNEWNEAGGTGIKLINGINDTHGTWQGRRVGLDMIHSLQAIISEPFIEQIPEHVHEQVFDQETKQENNTSVPKKEVDLQLMKDSISIADYARDVLGLSVIKEGKGLFRLEEHDSCKIYPNNTFYRFSNDIGGSIIDFIKHFEELDTRGAIDKMKVYYKEFHPEVQFDSATQIAKPRDDIKGLVMPEKAETNKHVYAYLTKTRGIQPSIVNELINRKLLYEDVQRNCVFVGKHDDTIQYASLRSSSPSSKFKQDAKGSVKEVGIYVNNQSNVLVVNEAIIDSMSYMSLADDSKKYNYLAVNGAANCEKALKFHMMKREEAKEIEHIVLALDNDEAGEKNMEKTLQYIKENYPKVDVSIHLPEGNDFNEQLMNERQLVNEFAPVKNASLELA